MSTVHTSLHLIMLPGIKQSLMSTCRGGLASKVCQHSNMRWMISVVMSRTVQVDTVCEKCIALNEDDNARWYGLQ